jgi:hypothetical protein
MGLVYGEAVPALNKNGGLKLMHNKCTTNFIRKKVDFPFFFPNNKLIFQVNNASFFKTKWLFRIFKSNLNLDFVS